MVSPVLAAQTFVLKGTNIGGVPTDAEYLGFVGSVINGVLPNESPVSLDSDNLVDYPASFWPVSKGGFSDPKWNTSVNTGKNNVATAISTSDGDDVIFGYSQGAVVASQFKASAPNPEQDITYVLLANPSRPNGGFLERFAGITIPILDVTATGATPAEGGTTYDIALQYDGWTDFPRHLNALSIVNAFAGTVYLHGFANQAVQINVGDLDDPTKTDIISDGETTYYTVATPLLPILIPFEAFIPHPLLTALDAPLRVMVEWGYDRSVSPGTPETMSLIHFGNPIQNVVNLLQAIPIGIDDGLSEAAGDPDFRPLGTTPVGMYGVGGRQVSTLPSDAPSSSLPSAASGSSPSRSTATSVGAQVAPVRAVGHPGVPTRRSTGANDRRTERVSKPASGGQHVSSARATGGSGR